MDDTQQPNVNNCKDNMEAVLPSYKGSSLGFQNCQNEMRSAIDLEFSELEIQEYILIDDIHFELIIDHHREY